MPTMEWEPPTLEDPISIQFMSDIHLEFPFRQKDGSRGKGYTVFDFPKMAPNLALLGDIGLACEDGLFQFLERNLRRFERVFFVMGNHEGYGGSYAEARERINKFKSYVDHARIRPVEQPMGDLIFLDRTRYDMSNRLTILGCTLWSHVSPEAEINVKQQLNDFYQVKDWTLEKYLRAHAEDVAWLNSQIQMIREAEPHRDVVIFSHHAPTMRLTSAPWYDDSDVRTAFSTEMTVQPCWAKPLKLWAFGHTHWNCDFEKDGVRIVSNQRGYEGSESRKSNFKEDKVLVV